MKAVIIHEAVLKAQAKKMNVESLSVVVGGCLDPLRRGGPDWLLRQPDARHPPRLPAARLPW